MLALLLLWLRRKRYGEKRGIKGRGRRNTGVLIEIQTGVLTRWVGADLIRVCVLEDSS